MMSYPLILHLLFAMAGSAGFCLLFHVPARHIFSASLCGGAGWFLYNFLLNRGTAPVAACFLGACAVAFLSEVFSRAGKDTTTLFIIAGIIPLVPGAQMYYTMIFVISGEFQKAALEGTKALFLAGSIAVALLLVASFVRIFAAVKQMIAGRGAPSKHPPSPEEERD